MERSRRSPLLPLLLLRLLLAAPPVRAASCPRIPEERLACTTDYNRTITCAWNGADEPDSAGASCTLLAERVNYGRNQYSASCKLEPVNVSIPALQKCSMVFEHDFIFTSGHDLSINQSCKPDKQILKIDFKPVCHIKLNPPGKPTINDTTVSWRSQGNQTKIRICGMNCTAQLDPNLLAQGQRHEARTRVRTDKSRAESTWSDWSPTASWVSAGSPTTEPPPPPLSDFARGLLVMIVAGAGLALSLAVIGLFRNIKTNWAYKKIRSPDPGKSFLKDVNFQNWLSPYYTSESFRSPLTLENVVSVEVISKVDAVILCGKEAALLEKISGDSSYESTSSSFSNPSYSQLCPRPPPPPVPLPTAGNLKPRANDTPQGSFSGQCEGRTAVEGRDEERPKELEILQLLSKGRDNGEPVQVISDYEKVEKLQVEMLLRLQNEDSGMCIGEEVSQQSLEADSISADGSHDEGAECKDEEKEGGKENKVNFLMLFGGSGSVFGKGSIQVCSDYEQVQRLQPGNPEHPSLDSGVSSGGEEQVSHEESLEDVEKSTESTSFMFPPPPFPPSCAFPRSVTTCPQPQPTKFSGTGVSPAPLPPSPSPTVGRIALMAVSRSMEPSGDGYMPARQEPR